MTVVNVPISETRIFVVGGNVPDRDIVAEAHRPDISYIFVSGALIVSCSLPHDRSAMYILMR